MREVELSPSSPDCFGEALDESRLAAFERGMRTAAKRLSNRTFWHVNSTDQGGGVAEMLQSLLPYLIWADVRTRWLVVEGDDAFFDLTKQIHHRLHGSKGDGSELNDEGRAVYENALRGNRDGPFADIEAGDVVLLHDPQTVGLAPELRDRGAAVIWGCHIGADEPNDVVRSGWRFLMPYVEHTDAQVFSRRAYVWDGLREEHVAIIPPCIDVCSPKNADLEEASVGAILAAAGFVDSDGDGEPSFVRLDGTPGVVSSRAEMVEAAPLPAGAPMVVQVSRWDPLKDMAGVLRGFAAHVSPDTGSHLLLVGPAADSVDDDPEAAAVIEDVRSAWKELDEPNRERVHLVSLPMEDVDENAAIVNALQRRADVVVQKSLAEGFGLTVAEAMWKSRAVIGSRVGGIQDQIEDGASGVLIDDPTDLEALGGAVTRLLNDPDERARLGAGARTRVEEEYLAPRYLDRMMDLAGKLVS